MRMRKRGLTWHVSRQSSVSFIHPICPSASASMFALSTQQHRSVSVVTECSSIDGSQCYVVICYVSFIRENSLSSFLALWGNKNGLPVWKWKSWENIWTKLAQRDANCSIWTPQALEPYCFNQLWSWENWPIGVFSVETIRRGMAPPITVRVFTPALPNLGRISVFTRNLSSKS